MINKKSAIKKLSKIADEVYDKLHSIFKFENIISEYYVNYNNNRLYFDFYLKSLGVLIEVQGKQHFEFTTMFHKTIDDFYSQKRRDNLKVEYCEKNNLTLVYFYDRMDNITDDLILKRIYGALTT
jgi:hypothetical protein